MDIVQTILIQKLSLAGDNLNCNWKKKQRIMMRHHPDRDANFPAPKKKRLNPMKRKMTRPVAAALQVIIYTY